MHDCRLGSRGHDDEVAVPGRQLLERGEQLLPLGAALDAAQALLELAGGELDALELALGALLRRLARRPGAVEQDRRGVGRVELGLGVGRPRGA